MIQSMTAFSREEAQFSYGSLIYECRTVNHRYLEVNFRLPDCLKRFELKYRELIKQQLKRGKIDLSITLKRSEDERTLQLNEDLVDKLTSMCDLITKKQTTVAAQLSLTELLNWPGVLMSEELDLVALETDTCALLRKTLDSLIQMRLDEGHALNLLMQNKLSSLMDCVLSLRPYQESLYATQKEKILARLSSLSLSVEPERLEQELVLWAQKMDIQEELDRLSVHITKVQSTLESDSGPGGRKLDFWMQEMNREANTIASKAQAIQATDAAVEMKILIEQLREQIQNVE